MPQLYYWKKSQMNKYYKRLDSTTRCLVRKESKNKTGQRSVAYKQYFQRVYDQISDLGYVLYN